MEGERIMEIDSGDLFLCVLIFVSFLAYVCFHGEPDLVDSLIFLIMKG